MELFFIPQSMSTTVFFFLPVFFVRYVLIVLMLTSATRFSLFGSRKGIFLAAAASFARVVADGSMIILPGMEPCVRRCCVSARVSMPVIAGMLLAVSQSPSERMPSQ